MQNPFKKNKTISMSISKIEPDSWGCIVEGYYWAVKLLFDQIINSKKFINQWVVYSILYNIRHYYELSLKDILINLGYIANDDFLIKEHNINKLLNEIEKRAKEYYKIHKKRLGDRLLVEDIDKTIKGLREYMDFFIKYDNDSFAFRYPYNKNNKPYISNNINFECTTFYESVKSCRKLLTKLSTELLCDDINPIFD